MTKKFPVRTPSLQLGFYKRLKEFEKTYLLKALLSHIGTLEISKIDSELQQYASNEQISFVAKKGLRGELVYPVPYILKTNPKLIGYYRLLLGFSQKEFYKSPYSRFKSMEMEGNLSTSNKKLVGPLCDSLIESSWILVNGLPHLSEQIIEVLTLLTVGPQFRGSRNVNLGTEAIQTVFALIKSIVAEQIVDEGENHLEIENPSHRHYRIEFSPDPDIAIRQILENQSKRNRIAIEIKGGKDFSNIHNRLGEAEKSHQKAKADGFTQFWTIINVASIDKKTWKKESPTTNEVFYLEEISNTETEEYLRFREYLVSELGL